MSESTELMLRGETTVDLASLTLEQLAETASREARLAESSMHTALMHAVRCGEALLLAYERVPHGQWQEWVRENVEVAVVTAGMYMRIAYYKDDIPEGMTSWVAARNYLSGKPRIHRRGFPPAPEAIREEARRMRAAGQPFNKIASTLGYSEGAIKYWTDPKYPAKQAAQKRRQREERARQQRAEEALRRQEQAKAVKRYGNQEAEETFISIRRALDASQRALDNSNDVDFKAGMRAVQGHLYKAEEEMLATLKIK